MHNAPAAIRTRTRDRGFSLIALLSGIGLAAVVLVFLAAMFVNQNQQSRKQTDHGAAQTSLVTLSNRVVRDVQVANPIVYAAADEIVIQTKTDDGDYTLTRYSIEDGEARQQVWVDAPARYTASDAAHWSSVPDTQVASDVSSETAFTYYNRDGEEVTGGPFSSYANAAQIEKIARVDVALKGTVKGKGLVAVNTSGALRNADGDPAAATAIPPVCPAFTVSSAADGAKPTLTWGGVDGVITYLIHRDGQQVGTINAEGAKPTYTWTDDTAGQTGNPVSYQLLATTTGGTSTSCTPVVWSPPAAKPAVTAAVYPQAVTDPSAWNTSGATAPYMILNWDKVDNASGYVIQRRELDPSTYQPLSGTAGRWGEAQQFTDPNLTQYRFDSPGYGRAYEFFVTATSRTGESLASNYVKLLSLPAAPQADAPVPTDYNKNQVNWNTVPTATGYEVWRYADGATPAQTASAVTAASAPEESTGAPTIKLASSIKTVAATSIGGATKVGTVGKGVTTFTDNVDLGTKYYYFVTAINQGPRDQTGTSASRYSAAPSSNATQKANTDSALQFPPDPVKVVGTGSESNTVGTNKLTWGATKSATGYSVRRLLPLASQISKTANVGTALSYSDTGIAKGTKWQYYVAASNATGISPNAAGVTVPTRVNVYQLPAAPKVATPTEPTLSSNSWRATWNDSGDAGNPDSAKFCNSTECKYEVYSYNESKNTWSLARTSYALSYSSSQGWGATGGVYVVACNPGGCSGISNAPSILSYPGPFSTAGHDTARDAYSTNSTLADNQSAMVNASLYMSWSNSAGGYAYQLNGPGSIYTSGNNGYTITPQPGSLYNYSVRAYASNGLSRLVNGQYQTAPDMSANMQVVGSCGANQFRARTYGDFSPSRGGWTRVVGMLWDTQVGNVGWQDISGGATSRTLSGNQEQGAGWVNSRVELDLPPGATGSTNSVQVHVRWFQQGYLAGCAGGWREPTPGPWSTRDGSWPIYFRSL